VNPKTCPACGSRDTEEIQVDTFEDTVDAFRACRECPTDYCLTYADPEVTDMFRTPNHRSDEPLMETL